MENKEIKIQVPAGYVIDEENSTFECIKFKSKKLTYDDVANALFIGTSGYYISSNGKVCHADWSIRNGDCVDANNAVSKKQCEKVLALNKLINVAKYLNGDWEPDFDDYSECKYYIIVYNGIDLINRNNINYGIPCFKSKELAEQAIEILGEDTIKLALSQV